MQQGVFEGTHLRLSKHVRSGTLRQWAIDNARYDGIRDRERE